MSTLNIDDLGEPPGSLVRAIRDDYSISINGQMEEGRATIRAGTFGVVCGVGRLVWWAGIGRCFLPDRTGWEMIVRCSGPWRV
jgi:hypothetical protein